MKYFISDPDGLIDRIGEKIPTKGNDEEFPTFRLANGQIIGAHISRVTPFDNEGDSNGASAPR